jgi:hypothetical protein
MTTVTKSWCLDQCKGMERHSYLHWCSGTFPQPGASLYPADLKAINNIVRIRNFPVLDTSSSYFELDSGSSMLPARVPPPKSECRITADYEGDLLLKEELPFPEEEMCFHHGLISPPSCKFYLKAYLSSCSKACKKSMKEP